MDPDAFAKLVAAHGPALALFARQWCGSAEDVVQTAFLKLARLRAPPDKPVPWLYAVVRNAARDAARSARRRSKYEARIAEGAEAWFLPAEDPAGLDAELAAKALSGLPDELREIIVMHLWGGLTFEQIAGVQTSSASTVFRRYTTGLDRLRELMGAKCRTE
jgi:RNA polymerase sigma factor (sigma-70 family)